MKNRVDVWDEETGTYAITFTYNRKDNSELLGYGQATCHPEDREYMSERSGCAIAEYRAGIDMCQNIIANDLKPRLAGLLHYKGTMVLSKKFNPKSYEAKRLDKEIKNLRREIKETKDIILNLQFELSNYIKLKDQANNK